MRLFNKKVVALFVKEVHEHIEVLSGTIPSWLVAPMFVPLPDTAQELVHKWRGYLALERTRRTPITVRDWLRSCARDFSITVLYMVRLGRILLFCRGTRLPLSYEYARIWYQLVLIKDSFVMIRSI